MTSCMAIRSTNDDCSSPGRKLASKISLLLFTEWPWHPSSICVGRRGRPHRWKTAKHSRTHSRRDGLSTNTRTKSRLRSQCRAGTCPGNWPPEGDGVAVPLRAPRSLASPRSRPRQSRVRGPPLRVGSRRARRSGRPSASNNCGAAPDRGFGVHYRHGIRRTSRPSA